jgi:hypothetical protein
LEKQLHRYTKEGNEQIEILTQVLFKSRKGNKELATETGRKPAVENLERTNYVLYNAWNQCYGDRYFWPFSPILKRNNFAIVLKTNDTFLHTKMAVI